MGCGAVEATGLDFVCFVVPRVLLSANRVDFGLYHKFSNFTLPQIATSITNLVADSVREAAFLLSDYAVQFPTTATALRSVDLPRSVQYPLYYSGDDVPSLAVFININNFRIIRIIRIIKFSYVVALTTMFSETCKYILPNP